MTLDYPWTIGAPARPFFRVLAGLMSLLMVLAIVLLLTFGHPWSVSTCLAMILFSTFGLVVGTISATGRIPGIIGLKTNDKTWPLDADVLAHQVDLMLREADAGPVRAVIRANGKECIQVSMQNADYISFHVPYPFTDDIHDKIKRGQLQLPVHSDITLFTPMRGFGLVPGLLWVTIPTSARGSIHSFISSILLDLYGLQYTDRFSISAG